MKPITLHPTSVLAGLGLAALLALVSGAAQSAGSTRPVPVEQQIIGHIPASWWTWVTISHTTPFTVPSDRYFVVTTADIYAGGVQADGNWLDFTVVQDALGPYYSVRDTGTRLSFPPGTVLALAASSTYASTFWGYLEPVN